MTAHITQATLIAAAPGCDFVWFCEDESVQIVAAAMVGVGAANEGRFD